MKRAVRYNGSTSESFNIQSGVKQGCVLASTLFGIFFVSLLKHAFDMTTPARKVGCLNFRTSSPKPKYEKVSSNTCRLQMMLQSQKKDEIQTLMNRFCVVFRDFELSAWKCECFRTGCRCAFNNHYWRLRGRICEPGHVPRVCDHQRPNFGYKPREEDWKSNYHISVKAKMRVYTACIIRAILYESKTWTSYVKQEKRRNTFHLRFVCRVLRISL